MSPRSSQGRDGPSVLLVEDDAPLREAVARALRKNGFSVTPVETGADAVEKAATLSPDAVVMDLFLPDGGGLGIAREIRKLGGGAGAVPILFVTALSLPALRDELAPAPVLFKPFTQRQLVSSLRELTRQR
jgi:two-component system OmpR family response regulator